MSCVVCGVRVCRHVRVACLSRAAPLRRIATAIIYCVRLYLAVCCSACGVRAAFSRVAGWCSHCRRNFYDKRISQEVDGETLGEEFKGYVFRCVDVPLLRAALQTSSCGAGGGGIVVAPVVLARAPAPLRPSP
jgi:hypothetical protein